MVIKLNKIPLEILVENLDLMLTQPPRLMTYWKSKIISPTIPSKKLKYG